VGRNYADWGRGVYRGVGLSRLGSVAWLNRSNPI